MYQKCSCILVYTKTYPKQILALSGHIETALSMVSVKSSVLGILKAVQRREGNSQLSEIGDLDGSPGLYSQGTGEL